MAKKESGHTYIGGSRDFYSLKRPFKFSKKDIQDPILSYITYDPRQL